MKNNLRIVFMGTPVFAASCLRALVEGGYNIAGVVTAPDKPAGRGMQVQESAVKSYACEKGLPLLQPQKLKDPYFLDSLRGLNADLQVVVAFRMLPEAVWQMPPLGTFNLHASLLPQYRGAAPVNHAIINGEQETGLTTFMLDHEIDTGRILFSERIKIGYNDTAGDLHDRLMFIGGQLVLKTVEAIASGSFQTVPQDSLATDAILKQAPKITKEYCRINWAQPGEQIRNFIRGLSPYPAAWTVVCNEEGLSIQLKIFGAEVEPAIGLRPGMLVADQTTLKIATSDSWLHITELQPAGKKRMRASDFLRGVRGELHISG